MGGPEGDLVRCSVLVWQETGSAQLQLHAHEATALSGTGARPG